MSDLIEQNYVWRWDEGELQQIENDEKKRLNELFVGHSVKKVAKDHLQLDDGTMIRLVGNEGCGGCISGYYELAELGEVENVITKIEVLEETGPDEWSDTIYRLFVFADHKKINLATFEGSDGNGYYGTGFRLIVRRPQ